MPGHQTSAAVHHQDTWPLRQTHPARGAMLAGGHFADLRLPAIAAQPFPSVPDAAAPENRQAAAQIKLGLDLEAHSAASLAFLHEVRHSQPKVMNKMRHRSMRLACTGVSAPPIAQCR